MRRPPGRATVAVRDADPQSTTTPLLAARPGWWAGAAAASGARAASPAIAPQASIPARIGAPRVCCDDGPSAPLTVREGPRPRFFRTPGPAAAAPLMPPP